MKLTITENRVKEISIKWLDKKYGDGESFRFEGQNNILFFYLKNGKVIFSYNPEVSFVRIKPEFFDLLEEIFGMNYDMASETLSNWISISYGLENTRVMKNIGKVREELFNEIEGIYRTKNN